MPVAAGKVGDARGIGDVLEGAVAAIPKQPVAGAGGGPQRFLAPLEWAALDAEYVKPAVAVKVQQRETAAGRFWQLVKGRLGVVVDESQADGFRIVAECESFAGLRVRGRGRGAACWREFEPRAAVRGEGGLPLGVVPIEARPGPVARKDPPERP